MDARELLDVADVERLHRRAPADQLVTTLRNGVRLDTAAKVIEYVLRHNAEREGRVNRVSAEEWLLEHHRRRRDPWN